MARLLGRLMLELLSAEAGIQILQGGSSDLGTPCFVVVDFCMFSSRLNFPPDRGRDSDWTNCLACQWCTFPLNLLAEAASSCASCKYDLLRLRAQHRCRNLLDLLGPDSLALTQWQGRQQCPCTTLQEWYKAVSPSRSSPS